MVSFLVDFPAPSFPGVGLFFLASVSDFAGLIFLFSASTFCGVFPHLGCVFFTLKEAKGKKSQEGVGRPELETTVSTTVWEVQGPLEASQGFIKETGRGGQTSLTRLD